MIFYLLSFSLLLSAVLVVTLKNLFHCALFLIIALLSLAGLYFDLGAPFLGAVQLIVYVGAIVVLIIFAIMMTSRITDSLRSASNQQIIPALLASIIMVGYLVVAASQTCFPAAIGSSFDPILDLGRELLTTYLLPFELISVLLLVALVGAIALARKD